MRDLGIIIGLLFLLLFILSAIIRAFEHSIAGGVLSVIGIVVLFALLSIMDKKTPDQIKEKALKANKAEITKREREKAKEQNKKIATLKYLINEKTGFDVNPDDDEIEINGIIYTLEVNSEGWIIPWALEGRFQCSSCGNPRMIIKTPEDYGSLLAKYEKHKRHG